MAFWGDIIIRHPELISELPRDAVALEWGYEADHPFDAHGARFAASGIPFYVCPGTSSWNSLAGRTSNLVANVRLAAENGRRHGACGLLMTDWGDGGHWQPLAVSLAGLGLGACVAWCGEANRGVDAAAAADDCGAGGFGATLAGLGDVYRLCGTLRGNGTELFQLLFRPRAKPPLAGVTPAALRAVLARVAAASRRGGSRLDEKKSTIVGPSGLWMPLSRPSSASSVRRLRHASSWELSCCGAWPTMVWSAAFTFS